MTDNIIYSGSGQNNIPTNTSNLISKEILTLEEAAQYLHVSKSYLYKQTSRKLIPYYKPTGKLCYFKRQDLDAWLLSGRVSTQAEIAERAKSYCLKGRK